MKRALGVYTSIYMDQQSRDAIDAAAAAEDVSRSRFIRRASVRAARELLKQQRIDEQDE